MAKSEKTFIKSNKLLTSDSAEIKKTVRNLSSSEIIEDCKVLVIPDDNFQKNSANEVEIINLNGGGSSEIIVNKTNMSKYDLLNKPVGINRGVFGDFNNSIQSTDFSSNRLTTNNVDDVIFGASLSDFQETLHEKQKETNNYFLNGVVHNTPFATPTISINLSKIILDDDNLSNENLDYAISFINIPITTVVKHAEILIYPLGENIFDFIVIYYENVSIKLKSYHVENDIISALSSADSVIPSLNHISVARNNCSTLDGGNHYLIGSGDGKNQLFKIEYEAIVGTITLTQVANYLNASTGVILFVTGNNLYAYIREGDKLHLIRFEYSDGYYETIFISLVYWATASDSSFKLSGFQVNNLHYILETYDFKTYSLIVYDVLGGSTTGVKNISHSLSLVNDADYDPSVFLRLAKVDKINDHIFTLTYYTTTKCVVSTFELTNNTISLISKLENTLTLTSLEKAHSIIVKHKNNSYILMQSVDNSSITIDYYRYFNFNGFCKSTVAYNEKSDIVIDDKIVIENIPDDENNFSFYNGVMQYNKTSNRDFKQKIDFTYRKPVFKKA